jgi:hypothetical protein
MLRPFVIVADPQEPFLFWLDIKKSTPRFIDWSIWALVTGSISGRGGKSDSQGFSLEASVSAAKP